MFQIKMRIHKSWNIKDSTGSKGLAFHVTINLVQIPDTIYGYASTDSTTAKHRAKSSPKHCRVWLPNQTSDLIISCFVKITEHQVNG